MKQQIIYLNGASSSGKTLLAHALQEALDKPFLLIGIDKVIGMMPKKFNDWEGGPAPLGYSWEPSQDHTGKSVYILKLGPLAQKISNTYKEIVLTLVRVGHDLIIDDVAEEIDELNAWKSLLASYATCYVKVVAPLEIIEIREKERQNRMIGSARAQFHKIHIHPNDLYDLEINTHDHSTEDNVRFILSSIGQES